MLLVVTTVTVRMGDVNGDDDDDSDDNHAVRSHRLSEAEPSGVLDSQT